ncbi:ATP-binding protein [Pantanalinema rosaneae CENA516]|uniref:sensor histidine kinase n=1 Tax=Pantanalinema rosaneae TaxID=1620701 RepID=UPI003D6DA8E3
MEPNSVTSNFNSKLYALLAETTNVPEEQRVALILQLLNQEIEAQVQGRTLALQDVTERQQLEAILRSQIQKEQTLSRIILAIAFEQAELAQQVRCLNQKLEQQVASRAAELRLAFYFEATLKRITDEVRDSLNESQILQTAVQELALALNLSRCTIALYQRSAGSSTSDYHYPATTPDHPALWLQDQEFPELTQQLLQGEYAHYCTLPNLLGAEAEHLHSMTCLAYPLWDDQGALGNLWLYKPSDQAFNYLELQLVQQVANQCAIALRQSHLYQAVQAHAKELESLNQMKDEFLSTVSHELRAPMANIKMATQMLELVLTSQNSLDDRSSRYFQILKDECDRETNLINDLLDLSRLESGNVELKLTTLNLNEWIPTLIKSFQERSQKQQQQLSYHLATNLPQITTDVTYLERILTELLHNACKYTPAQQKIMMTITTQLPEQACPILVVNVTNTGVEISAPEQQRVFDKFYRIPSNDPWKHGGTGLGLALVKRLSTCLGGSIQLESHSGQTQFILSLPLESLPRSAKPGHLQVDN